MQGTGCRDTVAPRSRLFVSRKFECLFTSTSNNLHRSRRLRFPSFNFLSYLLLLRYAGLPVVRESSGFTSRSVEASSSSAFPEGLQTTHSRKTSNYSSSICSTISCCDVCTSDNCNNERIRIANRHWIDSDPHYAN